MSRLRRQIGSLDAARRGLARAKHASTQRATPRTTVAKAKAMAREHAHGYTDLWLDWLHEGVLRYTSLADAVSDFERAMRDLNDFDDELKRENDDPDDPASALPPDDPMHDPKSVEARAYAAELHAAMVRWLKREYPRYPKDA